MSAPTLVPAECALPGSPLDKARSGIDACVHCGFCLQACPTYLTLEDENDSPRGRIVLMRALLEGTLGPTSESVETHIARCLGCRACETVCPSGVPYGHLLEATRATLAEHRPIPFVARLILGSFERPWMLRLTMAGGRLLRAVGISRLLSRLPGRMGFAMAMLSSTTRPRAGERTYAPTDRQSANARRRGTVAVLTGCIMEGLFAETNRATERTLVMNDYALVDAPGQQCCGALHAHAGDDAGARRLAKANIQAFERTGAEYIAVNAAGCGAMMKEYGRLLADDPEWRVRADRLSDKVRDVSELLSAAGPKRGGAVRIRVAYDAPCHLLHAQRITSSALDLLRAIPELELVPLVESDVCCGSAGIYNLVEPDTSNIVLDRKLGNVATADPEVVASGNPGCLMQIGAGLLRSGSRIGTVHPVELLDRSYAAARRHGGTLDEAASEGSRSTT
ncbi:MAG TPA: heterodisulfide reductase-related iron-sulfur binding cluster [Gemmatimonadaceae bacterium]|nr:heterodisulfide reductase-related iron-sulfur binding cluster [Gemmatimonadaceae bacterium]